MTQQLKQPPRAARKISYAEFLNWDGENQHVEWVNGEVMDMAPVGDLQQDLKGFLLSLLRLFVGHYNLGVIRDDPFQMKTGPTLPGRAPDIMFVARRNLSRIRKSHLEGPADLVIEISGPGSRRVDREDKFEEYQRGGVREYWLLDPEREKAAFYRLGRDGRYHLIPVQEDGVYRSTVIKGLWICVDWFWQSPLPSEFGVLKEWGLIK